jgi:hypothetical protein
VELRYAIFSRFAVILPRFYNKKAGENSPAPFCLTYDSLYPTKWCELHLLFALKLWLRLPDYCRDAAMGLLSVRYMLFSPALLFF